MPQTVRRRSFIRNRESRQILSRFQGKTLITPAPSLRGRAGREAASPFLLMQCRYCLRNEMGFCTKSGKRAPWKEPLTISISDGREFQLQFDCKNCQMNVIG